MITISDLMIQSNVGFGTSGARGLATDMTDRICYAYSLGFLQYLQASLDTPVSQVAIAGDYRPSTPRIMQAVAKAVVDAGFEPINAGFVPTPAVAHWALQEGIPCIMVTGSHIPDDRNGIKFYRTDGEVLKSDEAGMQATEVDLDPQLFDESDALFGADALPELNEDIYQQYVKRYTDCFPADLLAGKRLGIYQHSSVARDLMMDIFSALGAETVALGYSDVFVPVDTEAIRQQDIDLAKQWIIEQQLDNIISTDGDGDRPLISDEQGNWLRGDVAGILVSQYLQTDALATPVSCNSAVEKCGLFEKIERTRIGSPYVIEAMQALSASYDAVAGYEANGGYLTNSDIKLDKGTLTALPTRDAILVPLAILALAQQQITTVSALLAELPQRFTASDRIKNFPTEISKENIGQLIEGGQAAINQWLQPLGLFYKSSDNTDGLRITLINDDVVHLRPSGNAPELRCYTESDTEEKAQSLNKQCLELLAQWRI